MTAWRYGGLEARCSCDGVEVWSSGSSEGALQIGGIEVWRFNVSVAMWRNGTSERREAGLPWQWAIPGELTAENA